MKKRFSQAVSDTLLLTIYAKALESKHPRRLFMDQKACQIMDELNHPLKLPYFDCIGTCLRTHYFDEACQSFIQRHEKPLIVILGCGLDNRQARIQADDIPFVWVDFLDVIHLRREFYSEGERSLFIADSLLDQRWIHVVKDQFPEHQCLFLLEGVLMYLFGEDIHQFARRLAYSFSDFELYFDTIQESMLPMKNKQKAFRQQKVMMHWGFSTLDNLLQTFGEGYYLRDFDYTMSLYRERWPLMSYIVRHVPLICKSSVLIQLTYQQQEASTQ